MLSLQSGGEGYTAAGSPVFAPPRRGLGSRCAVRLQRHLRPREARQGRWRARARQTLESARIDEVRAVAVLTQDDVVNIETGIVLQNILGHRHVPIVLRVYDRTLGAAVAHRFGFENVRSTVDLAAPWFIGAALGLQVVGTFSVGQRSFMVGGVYVKLGSELDGMRMADLSTQRRVIAITRPGKPVLLHPRRDTRLRATDTAYLVGPYRELLDTLAKGQSASRTSAAGSGRRTP